MRVLVMASVSAFGCGSAADSNHGHLPTGSPGATEVQPGPSGEGDLFKPLVIGNNDCYMALGYFPKPVLASILPEKMTIPDDATMQRYYPDTQLEADAHPILLSFCHGSNIRDVYTQKPVPEQEELMFLFPVVYEHDDGTKYLCSYLPVLYLDSKEGVEAGRLYYGLRKEYHESLNAGSDAPNSSWWTLEGIVNASFATRPEEALGAFPDFFARSFANPFLTVSYPPESKALLYRAKVYPTVIAGADHTFAWYYAGTTVTDGDDTVAVYSAYEFTMSAAMRPDQYFGSAGRR